MKKIWTKNQDVLIKPWGYIDIHLQIAAKSIFGGILKITQLAHSCTPCVAPTAESRHPPGYCSTALLAAATCATETAHDEHSGSVETAGVLARTSRWFRRMCLEGGKMREISCFLPEKKQAFLVTPKTCYNFKKMKFTTVVFWWKQFGKVVFWSNEIGKISFSSLKVSTVLDKDDRSNG